MTESNLELEDRDKIRITEITGYNPNVYNGKPNPTLFVNIELVEGHSNVEENEITHDNKTDYSSEDLPF